MKPEPGPRRLLDLHAGAPAPLRDALAAARDDLPSAAQLARLAARLPPPGSPSGPGPDGPAVDPTPAASAAAPAATASLVPALLAGAAAGIVASTLLFFALPSAPIASPPPPAAEQTTSARAATPTLAPVGTAAATVRASAPALAPETPTPEASAPAGPAGSPAPSPSSPPGLAPAGLPPVPTEALPAGAARHSETSDAAAGATAVTSAPMAGESESSLLQRAQAALAGNPGAAVALTNEHLARYPGGALAQEREVIAIAALVAVGRSAEARTRAAAFVQAHPRSAHRARIETLVPAARE